MCEPSASLLEQIIAKTIEGVSGHASFEPERIARLRGLMAGGQVPQSIAVVRLLKRERGEADHEAT